jgi:hypothetical protein
VLLSVLWYSRASTQHSHNARLPPVIGARASPARVGRGSVLLPCWGGGDESNRAVLREYLRAHGGRARAWYLSGPPALTRWNVSARTNGGPAVSYGRVGLAGQAHCSSCAGAGAVETTMHAYLHCPLHSTYRAQLLRAVNDAWRAVQAEVALTGGAA